MDDYLEFNRLFGGLDPFPYSRTVTLSIESARRSLDGALFIDRVLTALNLGQAVNHYPPKNKDALRQWHQLICSDNNNNITLHHKLSIVYYILLDIGGRCGGADRAERFAKYASIPDRYQIFMKGLWLMDTRNFELALEHLTHPSLISDFADDIITVLVHHAKDGDYSLPLAYYHTVQPSIQSSGALEALFDAVAQSNVMAAFDFSRSHADYMRRQLFQRLVLSVLGSGRGEEAAEKAFELTSLPLDADEEQWFRECLESGEAKRFKTAKDTLVMRRIVTGQSVGVNEKGSWATVLEGFKTGSGGRVGV
ncbi:nuclear pore complex assembly-domain-containing protein [Xylaria bambusicola]|uniref:nuclear pore complex assembly-domain-containing protein n=1 Tax=Xylaria bambusicola TaxID=326684 RepID=UPI002007CDBE|nr:nuclear pore complex assembly-domain-containing protein [Xylaria bambusicola]KAI0509520.1 nuclear pore complex assembly-domain-containing protein [Xylaria bambusicola]